MTFHSSAAPKTVLLTSVFGPYARDDEFGSRAINPMELYHNQVTRAQGPFSLRMHHRSWGLMLIQENIGAPSTLLDFPTIERFIEEITARHYDVIGISSIVMNAGKVREMCRLIRQYSPHSVIVVGGHVAAIPNLERMIDADYIVRGEGVRWMRGYLGEDVAAPIRHPKILSGFGQRALGVAAKPGRHSRAATIIPSVGCPLGCNFCATSAFFGGKGNFLNFYETGSELFNVMCESEAALDVRSFFVMDENFLLHRKRALELLECLKQHRKSWSLYVFASANAISRYSMEELVELGISWVWMGLESPRSSYGKLRNTDPLHLVEQLQAHGIRVLGSTIIGLEHHTPENIQDEIEHAVSHHTDFHQFMLYTPLPGTVLHEEMGRAGKLLDGVDVADIHGQYKFNFEHPAISRDESKSLLDWAFELDYLRNGPSLYRLCKTTYRGWMRYRDHWDARVRDRFHREAKELRRSYAAMLWVMEKYLKKSNPGISIRIRDLRHSLEREFGWIPRVVAHLAGPFVLWAARRENRRLIRGVRFEPPTIVERKNWPATAR